MGIEKNAPLRHQDTKGHNALFEQLRDFVPLWRDCIRHLNTRVLESPK